MAVTLIPNSSQSHSKVNAAVAKLKAAFLRFFVSMMAKYQVNLDNEAGT